VWRQCYVTTGNIADPDNSDFLLKVSGTTTTIAAAIQRGQGAGIRARGATPRSVSASVEVSTGKWVSTALTVTPPVAEGVGTYGVQGTEFDFTVNPRPLETADCLVLPGGRMGMYDGGSVVELGFHNFPDEAITTDTSTGSVSTGTHNYDTCVVYEWVDAQGVVHQSAASNPNKVNLTNLKDTRGFSYKVPTLRLTDKKTPVLLVVYRTSDVGGASAGQMRRVATAFNDVSVDYVTITESLTDAQLETKPFLTSNPLNSGSEVAPQPAPSTVFAARYRNRVIAVPSESPETWIYSKPIVPGVAVEFEPFEFVQPISQSGGAITGAIEMDDKLILFKKDRIFYTAGEGPTVVGTNNDYATPFRVPCDVGAVDDRSLVLTPKGVMFKSQKGVYLLGRDLSTQYIGYPVEEFNGDGITSANLSPDSRRVIFTTDNEVALVYDLFTNQWCVWTAFSAVDAVVFNGNLTKLETDGKVNQQRAGVFTDNGAPVLIGFTTSRLAFAEVSGHMRLWRFILLGDYRSPHKFTVSLAFDDNPALVQNVTVTPEPTIFDQTSGVQFYKGIGVAGVIGPGDGQYAYYEWQVRPMRQRCSSMQITFQEHATRETHGEGVAIAGMLFLVGEEPGLHKVPAVRSI
jgi:hypothetical protein